MHAEAVGERLSGQVSRFPTENQLTRPSW